MDIQHLLTSPTLPPIRSLIAELPPIRSLIPELPCPDVKSKETNEEDDAAYLAELKNQQAMLNRNVPRRKQQPKVESDDESNEEDDGLHEIEDFLSVDPVSNCVLVLWRNAGGEKQWIPYLYLRWACSSLRDKKGLDKTVHRLLSQPIIHGDLPRTSIQEFHQIRLMHFIPPMNGEPARIVYRLYRKRAVGVTTLDLIRKDAELDEFVKVKQEQIAQAGNDKRELARIMGLDFKHHDCSPQFDAERMLANWRSPESRQPVIPSSDELAVIHFMSELYSRRSSFNIPSPNMPTDEEEEEGKPVKKARPYVEG